MGAIAEAVSEDKITCCICGDDVHAIKIHLEKSHPTMSVKQYEAEYVGQPLLSPYALKKIEEHKLKAEVQVVNNVSSIRKQNFFHQVFELGEVKAALNSKGDPIPTTVLDRGGAYDDMIPEIDSNHVFDVELLKNVVMGLELGIPTFVWGHAGTGKTSLVEQVAARTNRPLIRVQHTVGMEERDVLGQWIVKNGETVWQDGPLPMAMQNGWVYLADEYDFGLATVLGLYQPVLEGKSLVIKDAPPEHRVVRPHPNFRIIGTGNTNGSGDETGLYQGTNVLNAANFERFGIVLEVTYMDPEKEAEVLIKQAGIGKIHADRLVSFAGQIREQFAAGKLSHTISPRTLIFVVKLGMRRGSWRLGIRLAFSNRLSRVDREAAEGYAQRLFE